MTTALKQIIAILANRKLDAESFEDTSRCIEIERLAKRIGWRAVSAALISVLEDDERSMDEYRVVAEVIWGAGLDARPLNIDHTIALLLYRLEPTCEEDNLVWSITATLKRVGYNSTYEARKDPGVAEHLKSLLAGRNS